MSGYRDPEKALQEPLPEDGVAVPLRASFVGLVNVPLLSLGKNNLSALLRIYPDSVETKVFRTRRRLLTDIQRVEVQTTLATNNVEFVWRNSRLTFTGNVRTAEWRTAVLRYLEKKGVPLSDKALGILANEG